MIEDATKANITFTSTFQEQPSAIKYFATRFNLTSIEPWTITKRMHMRSLPCVQHDAQAMIESLLYSLLMVDDNMLFPVPSDPSAPPQ